MDEYKFEIDFPEVTYNAEKDRSILNQGLRERGYWPQVDYPADIYIVELAGIDPMRIPAQDGIGKYGYWSFVFVPDTQVRVKTSEGTAVRLWHQYTSDEKIMINRYWHLLSDRCKFEEE